MKKILIIGAGGVGSYLSEALHKYDVARQLMDMQVTIADDDDVDIKNIGYQNFSEMDILDNKAEVIGNKYNYLFMDRRIHFPGDLNLLKNYDCIISVVDGTKFRKNFFSFVLENPEIYWMDLRSTGKTVTAYLKHKKNDLETLLNTLPSGEIEDGSCQNTFELSAGIIQGGNRIIAEIGAQFILNWYRGEANQNPQKFMHSF